jgi:hypothetical protein
MYEAKTAVFVQLTGTGLSQSNREVALMHSHPDSALSLAGTKVNALQNLAADGLVVSNRYHAERSIFNMTILCMVYTITYAIN